MMWWTAKLYLAPDPAEAATDEVLAAVVAPLAAGWLARGRVDRFFFLRFLDDEGYHLRFRLRSSGEELGDSALETLRTLCGSRAVRVVEGAYDPEYEKYGGAEGVDVAERHFMASSLLALDCVTRTPGSAGARFLISAFTFARALQLAAIDGTRRARFLAMYRDFWRGFHRRVTGDDRPLPELAQSLADWWRRLEDGDAGARALVIDLLGPRYEDWERATAASLSELDALARKGMLSTTRELILANLAHTFHNRLGLGIRDEAILAQLLLGPA